MLLNYLRRLGVYGEDAEDALQDAAAYAIGRANDPARAADLLRGACLLMSRRHHQTRRARGGPATVAEARDAETRSATGAWERAEDAALARERAEAAMRSLARCPIARAAEVIALRAGGTPCGEIAEALGLGRGKSTVRAKIWKIRDWVRRDTGTAYVKRIAHTPTRGALRGKGAP
jgi:DNA-directed RNA polymerase specialized sigma24 family protein